MNPDVSSASYQRMVAQQAADRQFDITRRDALHRAAVARRRKAKRGGKR